ncbi:hypothetical protein [Halorubrum sp. Ib24]|uniref:hypothetical protein n=1 Tax=Halorubrum sp. Ib24 TaxID=1383850 RepID=UPI00117A409E|nr:hypothetical protein [Halorubrum sp. Ib24]
MSELLRSRAASCRPTKIIDASTRPSDPRHVRGAGAEVVLRTTGTYHCDTPTTFTARGGGRDAGCMTGWYASADAGVDGD